MENSIYFNPDEYDLIFDDDSDIGLWLEIANTVTGSILEIGCGTGRILVPLAKINPAVVGLDALEDMLQCADSKLKKKNLNAILILGDMRNFILNEKFDLIFAVNNVIGHIDSLGDLLSFLSNVKQHLTIQGQLILQLPFPNINRLSRFNGLSEILYKTYFSPFLNKTIELYHKSRYNEVTQINTSELIYKIEGDVVKTTFYETRLYFPQEIKNILLWSGFEITNSYGNYDKTPICSEKFTQIYVCQKYKSSLTQFN